MSKKHTSVMPYIILFFGILYAFFVSIDNSVSVYSVAKDIILTNIIKVKFILDGRIESSRIKIKSKDAIVTLSGSVQDQNSLDYIISTTKDIASVEEVISELIIGNQQVEIPIEYESSEYYQVSPIQYLKRKIKNFNEVFFNIFHYKNKILFDFTFDIFVIENQDEYKIIANLPINYQDLNIYIKNNDLLIIKGRIKNESEEDLEYFSKIKSYSNFEKLIILPDYCSIKKAKAFLNNKTVTIIFPKIKPQKQSVLIDLLSNSLLLENFKNTRSIIYKVFEHSTNI